MMSRSEGNGLMDVNGGAVGDEVSEVQEPHGLLLEAEVHQEVISYQSWQCLNRVV